MSKVTHLCFKYIESHASPLHLMFTTINSIVYKYYNHYQILELCFFHFYFTPVSTGAGFKRKSLKSL